MTSRMKEMEVAFETPPSLFGLPLPKISWRGTFTVSDAEERLAWGIYVELTTRVALAGLGPHEGSLREALSSYHTLFQFTREQLHEVGPQVWRSHDSGEHTPVAALVLWMLNGVVRPLLAKWYPRLVRWEETRADNIGCFTHEAAWPEADELRQDLNAARDRLNPFARLFETVCHVSPSLLPELASE